MSLDAAFGFQSQSTKALASIDSTKYPDTNKDVQQNLIRLNQFVDYIASYLQTMQKGIDKNTQDPIAQIQGLASDLVVLLGGGELLYGIDLGDLQYFLPAIGALLGFDGTTPFPINLFNAAEHFLLGYVVPLDSFTTVILGIVDGWATALGLDPEFIASITDLLNAFDGLEQSVEEFLTTLEDLLNILGPMDGFGELWHVVTQLLGGLNLADLGSLIDPVFHLAAPWIEELATAVDALNNIIMSLTGGVADLETALQVLVGLTQIPDILDRILGPFSSTINDLTGYLNFGSLFSSINFLDPLFDANQAAADWIEQFIGDIVAMPTELVQMIQAFANGETDVAGFLNFASMFNGINFMSGSFDPIEAATTWIESFIGDLTETAGNVIDAFVNTFLGLPGSGYDVDDLYRAIQSIPGNLIVGSLLPSQITHVNVAALSAFASEYLVNANFDTAESIIGQGVWNWDGTQGPLGVTTSIFTDANSTTREIYSNAIAVAAGQIYKISANTKWITFVGSANSIALTVAKFDVNNTLIGYDTISSIASPGTSGGWVTLSNTYTVPSGVATIFIRPTLTTGAVAGRVWFGKMSCKPTALTILSALVPDITQAMSSGVRDVVDIFWNTLSPVTPTNVIQTATGTSFPLNFTNPVTPGNTVILIAVLANNTGTVAASPVVSGPTLTGSSVPGSFPLWNAGTTQCVMSANAGAQDSIMAGWVLPSCPTGNGLNLSHIDTHPFVVGLVAYEVAGLGANPTINAQSSSTNVGTSAAVNSGTTLATTTPTFVIGAGGIWAGSAAGAAGFTNASPGGNAWAGYQISVTSGNTFTWAQTAINNTNSWAAGVVALSPSNVGNPVVAIRNGLQLMISSFTGQVTLGGMLLNSIIPGLDASKITTGQFAQTFVQNLAPMLAGFGTSTSIISQFIGLFPGTTGGLTGLTGLGSIFTDMLKVVGMPTALGGGSPVLPAISSIPVLAGLLTGSLIKPSLIANLDATVIATGQFAQTFVQNLAPMLAGFGTSSSILAQLIGMFPNTVGGLTGLAGLDAIFTDMLKVVGTPTSLGGGSPVLPAIGSIPVLGGLLTGTTTKTIIPSLISNLDATAITTGQFAQTFVVGLTTMFGGLLSTSSITSQLNRGNIADLGTITDHATNAFIGTGSQFINSTLPQARGSMDKIFNDLINATKTLQMLRSNDTAANISGNSFSVDFSNYADGALPSTLFQTTLSGTGSSAIGITNGNAGWRPLNNDGNRTAIIVSKQPSVTDYQIVRGTMAAPPAGASSGGQPRIWVLGRVDSFTNPQNYVWARGYCTGFLTYKGDVGYTVAGVDTVLASNIPLTWSMDIAMVFGVGNNPRAYQVYSGTQLVWQGQESGTASKLGNLFWGCKSEMKTGSGGASDPGGVAGTSMSDNAPLNVLGSTLRACRQNTGTVSLSSGTGAMPNGFYETVTYCSPDITYNPGTSPAGPSSAVITIEGTYLVNISFDVNSLPNQGQLAVALGKNRGGTITYEIGNGCVGIGSLPPVFPQSLSSSFLVYCIAGDVIFPANFTNANISNALTGDAAGLTSVFEVALCNHSLQ